MAKTNRDKELLQDDAGGRRPREGSAAEVADAVGRSLKPGETAPEVARQAMRDFSALAARLEDHISAGPPKRAAAAQKRSRTRKRPAAPLSAKEGSAPRNPRLPEPLGRAGLHCGL